MLLCCSEVAEISALQTRILSLLYLHSEEEAENPRCIYRPPYSLICIFTGSGIEKCILHYFNVEHTMGSKIVCCSNNPHISSFINMKKRHRSVLRITSLLRSKMTLIQLRPIFSRQQHVICQHVKANQERRKSFRVSLYEISLL